MFNALITSTCLCILLLSHTSSLLICNNAAFRNRIVPTRNFNTITFTISKMTNKNEGIRIVNKNIFDLNIK
jgi:hypothetical protein